MDTQIDPEINLDMKAIKVKKGKKRKEKLENDFRKMLEIYTTVPPSPLKIRRMRRSEKKHKKTSSKK